MPKHELPKGYHCKCGKFNDFHLYVYAHWQEVLAHKCECGREYSIVAGVAELKKDVQEKKGG